MSSYKPIDVSKEDFRKYLSHTGVLDAIIKALTKCNSDRPENALEYLVNNLGERVQEKETIARLTAALSDARKEIELLKNEVRALKGGSGQETETPGPDEVTQNVNKAASDEAPSSVVPAGDQNSTVPSVAGTTEGATKEETVPSPKASDTDGGSKQKKDAAPENDKQDQPVVPSTDKADEKE